MTKAVMISVLAAIILVGRGRKEFQELGKGRETLAQTVKTKPYMLFLR